MVPRNQRSYDRARVTNMYTCESPCPRVPHFAQTFHSCIYLVDPASMVPSTSRRHLVPHHTLSKTTISAQNPDETPPLTDDDGDSDMDTDSNPGSLSMLPAELRVIRRLAERVNVLPVIGRADSLTDDKLRAVKATLRREIYEADLGFGVFTPEPVKFSQPSFSRDGGVQRADGKPVNENGDANGDGAESESESDDDEEDDVPSSRPVITLRSGRQSAPPRRSRSRSRLELTEEAREPQSPDPLDPESVANVRFSASTVARSDLSPLLPFAIIAPEKYRRHRPKPSAEGSVKDVASENTQSLLTNSNSDSPVTPAVKGQSWPPVTSPPDDLKGVFVRRFRWGTVDVLDPTHCDFAALRTAVLSTHMKVSLVFIYLRHEVAHTFFTSRCSRRTRVKSYMKNSAQKNYSHDVQRRRLARNKQKSSSRVCIFFFFPP